MTNTGSENEQARRVLRSKGFWIAPIALVTIVMAALCALYLDSMLDPERNMSEFPIAVVNQDEGADMIGSDPPRQVNLGHLVDDTLTSQLDDDRINLQHMSIEDAQHELNNGHIYGVILIPATFTADTMALARASVTPAPIERPTITVYTNHRAGSIATALASSIGRQGGESLNEAMGPELTSRITAQLQAQAPGQQLTGTSALLLTEPVDVQIVDNNPLPPGTGFGLVAFYYTLLLILAGFTGATILNGVVDGKLGFVPTEIGPYVLHSTPVQVSRFTTMALKWAMMVILGVILSAVFLLISTLLGMPVGKPLVLYLFGILVISAVGITSVSVMAVFGGLGMLINLFFFIILGLPSSGGAIPLHAAPSFYGVLSKFEPMHQAYLGVRSILFFDARLAAGFLQAITITSIGLVLGLLFGGIITKMYDRRALTRKHSYAHPANA